MCASCGTSFVKPHGFKVVCEFCSRRMTTQEMAEAGVRVATEEEMQVAAHKTLARQRRTVKEARESKWADSAITTTRDEE